MRPPAFAALALILCAGAPRAEQPPQASYDQAMALAAAGELAAAQREAGAIADPLLRAQALCYVCFRGRDYAAALAAAEAALQGAPAPESAEARAAPDAWLWLAERAAAAALYFEATDRAGRWIDELGERLAGLPEGEARAGWSAAHAAHAAELERLELRELAREDSVRRARGVAIGVLGAAALALFALARGPEPAG